MCSFEWERKGDITSQECRKPEFVHGSNGRERAPLPAGSAGSTELVQGSGVTRLGVSEDDRRCDFCLTIDLAAAFQLSMDMQALVERKGQREGVCRLKGSVIIYFNLKTCVIETRGREVHLLLPPPSEACASQSARRP